MAWAAWATGDSSARTPILATIGPISKPAGTETIDPFLGFNAEHLGDQVVAQSLHAHPRRSAIPGSRPATPLAFLVRSASFTDEELSIAADRAGPRPPRITINIRRRFRGPTTDFPDGEVVLPPLEIYPARRAGLLSDGGISIGSRFRVGPDAAEITASRRRGLVGSTREVAGRPAWRSPEGSEFDNDAEPTDDEWACDRHAGDRSRAGRGRMTGRASFGFGDRRLEVSTRLGIRLGGCGAAIVPVALR